MEPNRNVRRLPGSHQHTLNIKPGLRSIKQGMWRFNQEKCQTMGEELSRLLATGFIKEV
jgi:hypothetical protein